MILVTVGTAEFQFNRLFKIIDELCDDGILNANEIIEQMGYTTYKPKNYKSFQFLENDQFKKYIDQSDFIITHSGVGTIINSLKRGKKIIVFPRLSEYGEHVDNHQEEIANIFTNSKYVLFANDKIQLKKAIEEINKFYPKKYVSHNNKMNDIIIDYIEGVFKDE